MKQVLVNFDFNEKDIDYIKSNLSDIKLMSLGKMEDKDWNGLEVVLGTAGKEILSKANNLKLIQVPTAGVNYLDFDLLKKYKIKVCNSHSNAIGVAELAVSMLLSLVKKTGFYDTKLRKNDWGNDGNQSTTLINGKVIGILGLGNIGNRIAKIMKAFESKVLAFDVNEQVVSLADEIYKPEKIEEIIGKCDFIFVCLPLTKETENLFDKKLISKIKKTAYIVNVARAEIINEHDLYKALINKEIAGAVIDVWWKENMCTKEKCKPSKYNFAKLDNLLMSPHRGGWGEDHKAHLDDAILNINNFFEGEAIKNVVNLEREF